MISWMNKMKMRLRMIRIIRLQISLLCVSYWIWHETQLRNTNEKSYKRQLSWAIKGITLLKRKTLPLLLLPLEQSSLKCEKMQMPKKGFRMMVIRLPLSDCSGNVINVTFHQSSNSLENHLNPGQIFKGRTKEQFIVVMGKRFFGKSSF